MRVVRGGAVLDKAVGLFGLARFLRGLTHKLGIEDGVDHQVAAFFDRLFCFLGRCLVGRRVGRGVLLAGALFGVLRLIGALGEARFDVELGAGEYLPEVQHVADALARTGLELTLVREQLRFSAAPIDRQMKAAAGHIVLKQSGELGGVGDPLVDRQVGVHALRFGPHADQPQPVEIIDDLIDDVGLQLLGGALRPASVQGSLGVLRDSSVTSP